MPANALLREMGERAARSSDRDAALLAALVHATDRCLVQKRIRRLIDKRTTVVVDRWVLSSVVYQSIQGLDRDSIARINDGILRPDITLLLMCPLPVRSRRLQAGKRGRRDLMFRRDSLRMEQVLYETLATDRLDGKLCVIDASADAKAVSEAIRAALMNTKAHGQRPTTP
jgi:thymidylate kinase